MKIENSRTNYHGLAKEPGKQALDSCHLEHRDFFRCGSRDINNELHIDIQ